MLYKIYYKDGVVKTVIGTIDDVKAALKLRPDHRPGQPADPLPDLLHLHEQRGHLHPERHQRLLRGVRHATQHLESFKMLLIAQFFTQLYLLFNRGKDI